MKTRSVLAHVDGTHEIASLPLVARNDKCVGLYFFSKVLDSRFHGNEK
ncbi:MAG: hypothetical protein K8S87_09850 [Planctomycetes bacterium]|nr:hypothetical protein [Planctomycetota bacterium]